MTRADAYAAGYAEGARWAEADIVSGQGCDAEADNLRAEATLALETRRSTWSPSELWAADCLGRARGYRLTVHRWRAGELTATMLENAPLNR